MVGIQGPVSFLIYNLFLVHILVFAAIAVSVWLPFITGKLGLWIVQDVYAPVMESGVHHVTRLLQAVTDPILDPIVDGLIVLSTWLSDGSSKTPALDASPLRVTNATANVRAAGQATIVRNATLYSTAVAADMAKTTAAPGSASFGSLAPIISFLEPLFGKAVPATAAIASEQMASPPDAFGPLLESLMKDPLILTSIGYMMYLALFFYYARQTGLIYHPYAQTTRRLVASVARYVYLAHKFSFFIVIELGMFPVFCGILVDICTLLVFGSGASVMQSRIVFYEQHPYTSIFLHLSMYISTVREVVRPGVMWFIRDPNDPHFNPMNEILERPILVQLRKLAIGTLLYASLVVGIVGGSVSTIYAAQTLLGFKQGTAKILPLRWEFHDHFSDFPIDLLVFHFLVPNVLKAIKPMVVFQSMLEFWFQCVARALRLTSFLFGGDFPDEESDWEDNDVHHDTAGAGVPLVRHLFAANDAHRGFAPLPQRPGAGDLFVAEVLANGDVVPIDQDDDEGEWEDEDEDVDTEANPVRHADIVGDGLFDGHNRLAGHVDNPGSGDMGTGQMEHGGTDLAAADEQQGIGANGITVGDGPAASTPGSVGGASQQGTRPVKPKREKRFMRVPNHDHVEIIPGQKMMVMMREEDPVFGRETESPDEVAANWTKVYTPDNFQKRIIVLLLLQWLSLVLLIVVIWVVPLVVGRLLFAAMNAHTIVTIAVPAAFGYTLPQPVPRADLPINDIYAYFGGVIFCFIASYPVQLGYSLVKKWTQLSRRNAIRRKRQPLGVRDQNRRRGRNAIGGLVGAVDTGVPANMSLATPIAGRAAERQESLWRRALQDGVWWWTRYGKQQAIRVYKALYLFFWVGCVVPLLFGLMVDIYVLTPFKGHPECTSVVFFIQDWAMGGILLKIAYNIILAGPESRIRQVLSQASQAGLRLDLGPISRELIFPMVAFTSFCLPLPTIGIYVEKSFGLSPYTVRDYFLRLGVPMLVLVLVANELLHGLGRVVRRWLDQIKDEQYLVGRRLHNVDDAIVVAATAAAAAAAPTAPPPPQPIVAPIQDQDEWVDDQ
ncbi:hypothetical protein BC831DRAFT_168458 [Entophlyctis helioformis]|nr:hypothetical protein BC831DRAFT_168458 [Entophlyctis helioformis]